MSTLTEKLPEKRQEIKFLHPLLSDPKKRPFSSPNEMVTFIIGTGDMQETFQIHKQVACQHSEVWDRAFNSAFIEGQTQTYSIEDTNPEAFRLLMQWVYQEKFDHVDSEDFNCCESMDEFFRCIFEYPLLLELWVLADKFLIRRLQNYTMNIMCRKQTVCKIDMLAMHYTYVYNNTAEDSALRRFVVAQSCWSKQKFCWTEDVFSCEMDNYPKEMLMDMVTAIKAQVPETVRERKHSLVGVSLGSFLLAENLSTGLGPVSVHL
ncbi:hypothetical protein OCU04_000109 [Sclerotinia nivalis]|uniref:BTB domain-containing protein n=1 Tax=Sclerotinia nivalis TaxID=352851 RepID=A0A9X0AVF3_9HELO|nr:hypothetical protein OCU04_000109 [Sclerotinia nivalis]